MDGSCIHGWMEETWPPTWCYHWTSRCQCWCISMVTHTCIWALWHDSAWWMLQIHHVYQWCLTATFPIWICSWCAVNCGCAICIPTNRSPIRLVLDCRFCWYNVAAVPALPLHLIDLHCMISHAGTSSKAGYWLPINLMKVTFYPVSWALVVHSHWTERGTTVHWWVRITNRFMLHWTYRWTVNGGRCPRKQLLLVYLFSAKEGSIQWSDEKQENLCDQICWWKMICLCVITVRRL